MNHFPPVQEQMDIIRRGAVEILPEEELVRKLERSMTTGQPLNIKLGCDPSRPDLHLGHSVVLRKMRQFQDLGHHATLIVGDFTGMIGDPSGRNKTRPPLTLEETRAHGQSYYEQASRILRSDRISIQYNSTWLGGMTFEQVIALASKYTVARMLERDEFEKRFRAQEPISIHEFLYPLAQAMDSVAIQSDVELGGTDQKFNLLVGREIQREYGVEPQVILTMPLLEGTDGVEKMSKSYGNYIAFNDSPEDMYGKVLSIPDALILPYFTLATSTTSERLLELRESLAQATGNPRDIKRELARTVVGEFYSIEAATAAENHFDRVFIQKMAPVDLPQVTVPAEDSILLLDLLLSQGLIASKGEGARLMQQGGVSIDGDRVEDRNSHLPDTTEFTIKVGKRRFLKVVRG